MESYNVSQSKRLASPLSGVSYNDDLVTVDPTAIEKIRGGLNDESLDDTLNMMNSQTMTPPIYPSRCPDVTFQHNDGWQHDPLPIPLSSPHESTPSLCYSASTPCSSRRESLAWDATGSLGPAFSPSPAPRPHHPQGQDISTFAYYSMEESSLTSQDPNFYDFQMDVDMSGLAPPPVIFPQSTYLQRGYMREVAETRKAGFRVAQLGSVAPSIHSWEDMDTAQPSPPSISPCPTSPPSSGTYLCPRNATTRDVSCRQKGYRGPRSSAKRTSNNFMLLKDPKAEREVKVKIQKASSVVKKYKCRLCEQSFERREHYERHIKIHDEKKLKLPCPLGPSICVKHIWNRSDNLKQHLERTHYTPSEKLPGTNVNKRISMKYLWERHLSGQDHEGWPAYFKGKRTDDSDNLWRLIRNEDWRWKRLLENKFDTHWVGKDPKKNSPMWRLIGWSVEEAQQLRIKTLVPEWDGDADTTLWMLHPLRKALEAGEMTLDDPRINAEDAAFLRRQQADLEAEQGKWTRTLSRRVCDRARL